MNYVPIIDRFNAKWVPEPNTGCWLWIGGVTKGGYGHLKQERSRKGILAHRFSYEHFKSIIPKGLTIDHLCRTRCCVNPDHLEAVTYRENNLRSPICQSAIHAKKTHCPKGHPYSGHNLCMSGGSRRCRKCHNEQSRLSYHRK